MTDYFQNRLGQIHQGLWRPRFLGRLRDLLHDVGMLISGGARKADKIAAAIPARRILVLGVGHPDRPGDLEAIVEGLRRSRHEVTASIVTMQADLGKFQNIARAIAQAGRPLTAFDWVIVTDDDITLPDNFLDRFVGLAESAGLAMAQPAHRFYSYTTFAITQRRWNSLVRATRFIEIGPISALRRDTLDELFPVPESRWDWGLDVYWAQIADRRGWTLGVVDAAPVEHGRPVAGGYSSEIAMAEAEEFLVRHNVTLSRADCHGQSEVVVDWRPKRDVRIRRHGGQVAPSSDAQG